MPFALIPFMLLAIPILEIVVFILVGREIGVWWTLACILATAVIGSALLRIQGFSILSRIRSETESGRIPGRELGDGAMILVAGILLLTPGFVTDAIGFALFVPAFRTLLWRFIAANVAVSVVGGGFSRRQGGAPRRGDVVDLDPEEFHEAGHEGDHGAGHGAEHGAEHGLRGHTGRETGSPKGGDGRIEGPGRPR